MNRAHRYIASLVLTAVFTTPVAMAGAAKPQGAVVQVRVYDRDHRDYHNWDDHEDRAYRAYLVERHREYLAYDRQSHREQRNYWNWRHSHPE
jgi:hypothetical protein